MKSAIIIMVKFPLPGTVKTRLQPDLNPEKCAELARCFLIDTETKVKNSKCKTIIAFSPGNKKEKLQEMLTHQHDFIEQMGNDLGAKMSNAFAYGFRKGFDRLVMIGTDSPTFPYQYLDEALEMLSEADSVLGETEDGGFYLIGLSKASMGFLNGVDWSTDRTFEQTAGNIKASGMSLELLPIWYDVDLPKDFERLRQELMIAPNRATETAEWLKKI